MSNVFEKISHGVEIAAKDVAHVAVEAVEFLPKATSVLASAIKDEPIVRQAVIGLVKHAEQVFVDGAVVVGDKGVNFTSDAKAIVDAEAFFTWFKSDFVPVIEKIYSEVKADIQN